MSRRFYKRCLLWLLPLLVVQSLVPVGFMVAAGDLGVTVGFCPVQSARVVEVLGQLDFAAEHSAHTSHVGHHASAAPASDSSEERANAGSCPYALTRTAIAHTPVAVVAVVVFLQVDVLDAVERLPILQAGPFAPNRIRGPPRYLA